MQLDKLLKIRHYMLQEEYKQDLISFMLEVATKNVGRNGNFQDGMLYMIDEIRKIPERCERERNRA